MKNGAIYIRVSTDKQEEFSPDAQKRLLLEYAKKNNIIVTEDGIFQDIGISGTKSENRPQFIRMIAEAKSKDKPFDIILVWKFSRFARNQEESIVYKSMLRKINVEIISISEPITEGLGGKLTEAILEIMDEYFSINLGQEVMRGMTQKVLSGGYLGYQPMGYEKANGGVPAVDEKNAKIVQLIFSKFVEEGLGVASVSRYLNENGILTRNGNKWERRGVEYMLRNPFYIGKIRWNYGTHKGYRKTNPEEEWIIVDGSHTPIISTELFEQVQDKLKLIKRPTGRRGRIDVQHWLSGILRCSECGGSINYHRRVENRNQSAYFSCRNYHGASCKTMQYTTVQSMEQKFFEGFINSIENVSFEIAKSEPKELIELDYLQSDLKNLETKEKRIKRTYMDGIDTIEEYKENKAIIQADRKKLEKKIKAFDNDNKFAFFEKEKYYHLVNMLKSDDFTVQQKNESLKNLCEKIVYNKKDNVMDFYFYS